MCKGLVLASHLLWGPALAADPRFPIAVSLVGPISPRLPCLLA